MCLCMLHRRKRRWHDLDALARHCQFEPHRTDDVKNLLPVPCLQATHPNRARNATQTTFCGEPLPSMHVFPSQRMMSRRAGRSHERACISITPSLLLLLDENFTSPVQPPSFSAYATRATAIVTSSAGSMACQCCVLHHRKRRAVTNAFFCLVARPVCPLSLARGALRESMKSPNTLFGPRAVRI